MKGGYPLHHDHHDDCGCHQHGEDCGCQDHHTQGEDCGCAEHHSHDENCGCAEHHSHNENCGCGHSHATLDPSGSGLNSRQADVLLAIHQRGYLPIARFALLSSRDENAYSVAMEPVYIADPKDDMETVKENGALFDSLEDMDLVTLDYDQYLKGYAYQEYEQSALYAYFVKTVKEASQQPGFMMDIPCLELGSVALAPKGLEVLQAMLQE
jgi:hypothetical protein